MSLLYPQDHVRSKEGYIRMMALQKRWVYDDKGSDITMTWRERDSEKPSHRDDGSAKALYMMTREVTSQ